MGRCSIVVSAVPPWPRTHPAARTSSTTTSSEPPRWRQFWGVRAVWPNVYLLCDGRGSGGVPVRTPDRARTSVAEGAGPRDMTHPEPTALLVAVIRPSEPSSTQDRPTSTLGRILASRRRTFHLHHGAAASAAPADVGPSLPVAQFWHQRRCTSPRNVAPANIAKGMRKPSRGTCCCRG
jgi:hypothetical protein